MKMNDEEEISSVKSLELPAPKGVIELVKCGCKGMCISGKCSCLKNSLVCTSLCKCSDCKNVKDYQYENSENNGSEEDNMYIHANAAFIILSVCWNINAISLNTVICK